MKWKLMVTEMTAIGEEKPPTEYLNNNNNKQKNNNKKQQQWILLQVISHDLEFYCTR